MITMKMNPAAIAHVAGMAQRLEVAVNTMPEIVAKGVSAVLKDGPSASPGSDAPTGEVSAEQMPWYKHHMIERAIGRQGLEEKWDDNAEYTKKKKGEELPVLVETGEMVNSFVLDIRKKSDGAEVWLSNTAGDNRWSKNWEGFDNPHEGWEPIPSRKLGYIGNTEAAQIAENLAKYLSLTLNQVIWQGRGV